MACGHAAAFLRRSALRSSVAGGWVEAELSPQQRELLPLEAADRHSAPPLGGADHGREHQLQRVSEGVVIERYRDSDALLEHFANLGDSMSALLQTYSSISGEILGTPSAALREALEGADVRIYFRTVDVVRLDEAGGCSSAFSERELPISPRRSPSDLGRSLRGAPRRPQSAE